MADPINDGVAISHGFWAGDPSASWGDGALVNSFPNFGLPQAPFTAATTAARPTFVTAAAALNGKPAISFDRNNSTYLQRTGVTLSQAFYITVICAATGPTATTEVIVGTGTVSGAAGLGKRSANDWYNASDAAVLSSGITYNSSPKLIVAKFSGGSSRVKVNNVVGTTGNAGTSNLTFLKVGAGGVGSAVANPFTGLVHLVLVTNYDPETHVSWPVIQAVARDCGVPV